jgi:hypothetical protein
MVSRCSPRSCADESDLPGSGRHEGKQAALDVLKDTVGVWDTFELSADEFIEQDDTVVVLGHFDVTKGDLSGRLPVVHIWRYRGEQNLPSAAAERSVKGQRRTNHRQCRSSQWRHAR